MAVGTMASATQSVGDGSATEMSALEQLKTDHAYWRDAWVARDAYMRCTENPGGHSGNAGDAVKTITRSVFSPDWVPTPTPSFDQFRRRFEVSTEWLALYQRFMQPNTVPLAELDAWNALLNTDPVKASKRADAAASTLRNVLWILHSQVKGGFCLHVGPVESAKCPGPCLPIKVQIPHVSVAYTKVKTGSQAGKTNYQILESKLQDLLVVGFHDHGPDDLKWIKEIDPLEWPIPDIANKRYVPFPAYRVLYEDDRAQVAALYSNQSSEVHLRAVNSHEGEDALQKWIEAGSAATKMPQVDPTTEDAFVRFVKDAADPYLNFRRRVFNREIGIDSNKARDKPSHALVIAFAVPAEPIETKKKEIDALYAFMSIELYCSNQSVTTPLNGDLTKILSERLSYVQEPLLRQLASERLADLEKRAEELRRKTELLDALTGPVETLSRSLNRAVAEMTKIQGIYKWAIRGAYERAPLVAPLFRASNSSLLGESFTEGLGHTFQFTDAKDAALALRGVIYAWLGHNLNLRKWTNVDTTLASLYRALTEDRPDSDVNELLASAIKNNQTNTPESFTDWDINHFNGALRTIKRQLHTNLKSFSASEVLVDDLKFALPKLAISGKFDRTPPEDGRKRLLLGAGKNPLPRVIDFIEFIASLTVALAPKAWNTQGGVVLKQDNGVIVIAPAVDQQTVFKPPPDRLIALFCSDWKSKLPAHLDASLGDFAEPIVSMMRLCLSDSSPKLEPTWHSIDNACTFCWTLKDQPFVIRVSLTDKTIYIGV